MNKVLIISTEYPPAARSSGVQRIIYFAKKLSQYNWQTSVLTMHPRAYGDEVNIDYVDDSIVVKRATAFNTAIHFSFQGRYLAWMALPDRWISWVVFGFFSGLKIIKATKPSVLFSSYPHASSHLLTLMLHKATGVPFVADFRDPMLYLNTTVTGARLKVYQWLEKQIMQSCKFAIFTTESAINDYIKVKYPEYGEGKWCLIENGFDEESFIKAEQMLPVVTKDKAAKITLLHSGGIFSDDRNPSCFFQALASLVAEKRVSTKDLHVIFRAPSDEGLCQSFIDELGLQGIVDVYPKIEYSKALTEMLSVDGLLIFQGDSCNFQIPAKLYEYFRCKKPILAFTDLAGDTAKLLNKAGISNIASLTKKNEIKEQLLLLINQIESKDQQVASDDFVRQLSRGFGTEKLARLLNSCLK